MRLPPLALLALCLTLGACQPHDPASPAAADGAAGDASRAGYGGFGALKFGMDEAAVRKTWGSPLDGGAAPGSDCAMLAPAAAKAPGRLAFMLEHGHFVRYDVRDGDETAPGGGKIGMDKAQLLALYGHGGVASPAKYEPGASQLRVEGSQGGVLIFDIGADGKVTAWRVGVPPQIDYVEACS